MLLTREEEIKKASVEANAGIAVRSGTKILRECCRLSFQQGAKWADANPKLRWISVDDDLPCNHSDLILTYNNIPFSTKRVMVVTDIHTLFLCEMKKDNNLGWIWNYSTKDKITHWFPIPKLPE